MEDAEGSWRTELASRESNGVKVQLFWSRSTNLVMVSVIDSGNGVYFELILDERERALDVFYHPYAHAAARGLDFAPSHRERQVVLSAS